MTNQIIPLNAVAAQNFTILLNNQNCKIKLYQTSTGLYCDISVNNIISAQTVLCLNQVNIVREAYQGLIGNLFFFDTQGTNDPYYTGLGSRYLLIYSLP